MRITFINIPTHLQQPLQEIAPLLAYEIGEGGTPVTVRQNEVGPKIINDENGITVEYHKIPEFFRMLTLLPERLQAAGEYAETPAFEDLCLMSDCSRNAVFSLKSAKRMIRYIALMGYNTFMLYTEDTYEIPEYPRFGHMRGRFTQAEMKAIDDYAYMFGIEVIPCIQVLAHLNAFLMREGDCWDIHDTADILMVGSEKTYALIDAMLRSCKACFRTDRIHIGCDEAHMLGLGRYLDQHGYRSRTELFLEHLNKVVDMCNEYGYKPMIWSDMFFRNAFRGNYYVGEGEIPQEVIDMVPENLSLVYWDYYNYNVNTVRHMIHCHKQFPNPVLFAGGAWKWASMAPLNEYSLDVNDVQLTVAKEEKIPMIIATTWGDDGAEASNFSVMSTLQQYAEYCYADGADRARLKVRFEQTFHMNFDDFMLVETPNRLSDLPLENNYPVAAKQLLYNDPLGGMIDQKVQPCYAQEYTDKAATLASVPKDTEFGYLLVTTEKLCRVLALKATLSIDIRQAYTDKDTDTLASIAATRIPATLEAVEAYQTAARKEWYYDNKTFGFEVIELRLGALKERLRTAKRTIEAYLAGEIKNIERLDETTLPCEPSYLPFWKIYTTNVL